MLHSMTITVIHVFKLETFYSCCGSQVNQGSLDVIGSNHYFDVLLYNAVKRCSIPTKNWSGLAPKVKVISKVTQGHFLQKNILLYKQHAMTT